MQQKKILHEKNWSANYYLVTLQVHFPSLCAYAHYPISCIFFFIIFPIIEMNKSKKVIILLEADVLWDFWELVEAHQSTDKHILYILFSIVLSTVTLLKGAASFVLWSFRDYVLAFKDILSSCLKGLFLLLKGTEE